MVLSYTDTDVDASAFTTSIVFRLVRSSTVSRDVLSTLPLGSVSTRTIAPSSGDTLIVSFDNGLLNESTLTADSSAPFAVNSVVFVEMIAFTESSERSTMLVSEKSISVFSTMLPVAPSLITCLRLRSSGCSPSIWTVRVVNDPVYSVSVVVCVLVIASTGSVTIVRTRNPVVDLNLDSTTRPVSTEVFFSTDKSPSPYFSRVDTTVPVASASVSVVTSFTTVTVRVDTRVSSGRRVTYSMSPFGCTVPVVTLMMFPNASRLVVVLTPSTKGDSSETVNTMLFRFRSVYRFAPVGYSIVSNTLNVIGSGSLTMVVCRMGLVSPMDREITPVNDRLPEDAAAAATVADTSTIFSV